MNKKVKLLLLLVSLSVCLGLMSSTYSRYVASAKGDINASFSGWQILLNNNDITSNSNSSINIEPVIEEQEHIKTNTIAPTSKGYFDIAVDPTNVDVSFKYSIDLGIDNENVPDLMITKYAIIPSDYTEGDNIAMINVTDGQISETFNYNKTLEDFHFDTFTIRIYFEWYEGENETMDDEADTAIGNLAATEGETFQISANIIFEQII